jgi:hypothetical protein
MSLDSERDAAEPQLLLWSEGVSRGQPVRELHCYVAGERPPPEEMRAGTGLVCLALCGDALAEAAAVWSFGTPELAGFAVPPCPECVEAEKRVEVGERALEIAMNAFRSRTDAARGVFRCPRCGRVSHNPRDLAEGYCGACHAWTGLANG